MKAEGSAKTKNGLVRFKFSCPKVKWVRQGNNKNKRQCFYENLCTTSSCGRMFYIYPEKDPRACPGTLRGTDKWKQTYKIYPSFIHNEMIVSQLPLISIINNFFNSQFIIITPFLD